MTAILRLGLTGFFAAAALLLVAPSASASSFGCAIPTIAVDIFWDAVDDGADFSDNESNCRRQCHDLRNGCNGVANGSKKCVDSGFSGFLKAEGRNCNDISDNSDRRLCHQENNSIQRNFRTGLRDNANDAKDDCRDEHEFCIDFCNGEIL